MLIVNVDLSFLRVCVNVDYILLLNDFFIDGLPKNTSESVDLTKKIENAIEKSKTEEKQLEQQQKLTCNIRIENPQFILYENQFELWKTNSLIIDVT